MFLKKVLDLRITQRTSGASGNKEGRLDFEVIGMYGFEGSISIKNMDKLDLTKVKKMTLILE